MGEAAFYEFVEGPHWAADLARIELSAEARDELMFALQDLVNVQSAEQVSHPLGTSGIRYIRSTEFPSLYMPPLYVTFRFERQGLIELRRCVTEEDVRAGLLFYDE